MVICLSAAWAGAGTLPQEVEGAAVTGPRRALTSRQEPKKTGNQKNDQITEKRPARLGNGAGEYAEETKHLCYNQEACTGQR